MTEKVESIISILKNRYPDAPCALHYGKDYELMIAVRLSAQCTDARVNLVTPALFAAYPTLEDMAAADISHVEELVHSCGFYKHKARDIVLGCQMLLTDYQGKVPGTMEELLRIPGVGRKTANVVLSVGFGHQRIAVDTHVFRLANRMGFVKETDVLKTELGLMKAVPEEHWSALHHALIWHGRQVCDARKPQCETCGVNELCKKNLDVKKAK